MNIVTKHQKPNQVLGKEGAIVKQEAFTHFKCCNLQCSNPKADRIAYQLNDGVKQRIYRSTGEVVATA